MRFSNFISSLSFLSASKNSVDDSLKKMARIFKKCSDRKPGVANPMGGNSCFFQVEIDNFHKKIEKNGLQLPTHIDKNMKAHFMEKLRARLRLRNDPNHIASRIREVTRDILKLETEADSKTHNEDATSELRRLRKLLIVLEEKHSRLVESSSI